MGKPVPPVDPRWRRLAFAFWLALVVVVAVALVLSIRDQLR